jgi:serine/threonine-protein kinase
MLTFDGRTKVIDFGIALTRDRTAPATRMGVLRGSMTYMAPEQMVQGAIDRRTDTYSLSIVLYELLTGEPLFSGFGRPTPPPPSKRAGTLPQGLDAIVLRGLAREQERRWQNARDLAEALEEITAREPGESLEDFARRTLGSERESHGARMRELTGAEPERGPTMVEAEAPRRSQLHLIPIGVIAAIIGGGLAYWTTEPPPPLVIEEAALEPPALEPPPPAIEALPPPEKRRSISRTKPRKKPPPAPIVAPPPPPPAGTALLTVGAEPYAVVLLDGRDLGATPLVRLEIPAGRHEIRFLRPDTHELLGKRTIDVAPGQHERITWEGR